VFERGDDGEQIFGEVFEAGLDFEDVVEHSVARSVERGARQDRLGFIVDDNRGWSCF